MRRRVIEPVLNDILGLHNKPRAAVHMLTKEEEEKEKKKPHYVLISSEGVMSSKKPS